LFNRVASSRLVAAGETISLGRPPAAHLPVRWSHRVEYAVLQGILGLFSSLSRTRALQVGAAIGSFLYRVDWKRRRIGLCNLRLAFPDKSDADRGAILRRAYCNVCRSAAESAHVGLRLHSADEKYVVQFRVAGFTLSRLPPYEKWGSLLDEARRIWAIYVQALAPKRVVRVATRFINNLNLPLETGESFKTYIHKLVDVPDEAPQIVETFFQRFHLVEAASGARVILTLALDGMPPAGGIPVILDVDAFIAANLNPADGDLWTILERLRELKNRSFFGTITEQAAELYQ
jgi:uncharacterized protein (TIGR04255 family)